MTCIITPYSLAFPDTYSSSLVTFDISLNFLFLVDIIINFLTAYHDELIVVDDHKVSIFFEL